MGFGPGIKFRKGYDFDRVDHGFSRFISQKWPPNYQFSCYNYDLGLKINLRTCSKNNLKDFLLEVDLTDRGRFKHLRFEKLEIYKGNFVTLSSFLLLISWIIGV